MIIKSTPHPVLFTIFIIAFSFSANLGNDIYLPSMTHLTKIFNTTNGVMQLSMTVWFVGVAIPQLFFGPLSDYFGRKPILLGGSCCFMIASLACALSHNIYLFLAARFFQGLGVCCLNVTSFGIFTDLYRDSKRIKVINVMTTFNALSPLVGPIIGGYIFSYLGWRYNFLFIFVVALGCLAGLWMTRIESNPRINPRDFQIKTVQKKYLILLKDHQFLKHVVPYCLALSGVVVYLTASPFIFIGKLHVPPQLFGYLQIPMFLGFLIGSLIVGVFSQTYKKIIPIGLILICFPGLAILFLLFMSENEKLVIIFSMMIYLFGLGFITSPLISEAMSLHVEMKGYASALLGFSMSIACVISGVALSVFYSGIFSFAILLTVISFSALFIYVFL